VPGLAPELARDLARQRGLARAVGSQALVEPADRTVGVQRPEHEAGAALAGRGLEG
jgi:hypothetical protein